MIKKILSTPTEKLGKAGRFAVFQIKLWSHCLKLLKKNRSAQQAATLSYHTLFGLVPLAIVMLLIFQLFPAYSNVGDNLKNLVYEQLHLTNIEYPDSANPEQNIMITDYLDRIVNSFFEGLNEGSVALFSTIIVIWAALALLLTIERSFNNIWHVARGRNFLHRIINYWAILTLGPLLLGAGIYASTRYATLVELKKTVLSHIAPEVLSYIIAVVIFFLLYFVLPNTKVKTKAAIWGAAVAALVWTFSKWLFSFYVIKFIPYSQVYGVIGLIPLGVFWIYISWIIVLFGLQLTFTTQHLKNLNAAEISTARRHEDYFIANDLTTINVVREIVTAFEKDGAPVEAEVVFSKLNIPAELGEKILNCLLNKSIVAKTSEPKVGFLPAKEPENIKLSDITDAVAEAGFAQTPADMPENLKQIMQSQKNGLAIYNMKQITT